MEEKAILRKRVLLQRSRLTDEERKSKSRTIVTKLLNHEKYAASRVFFAYLPFRDEVDIRPFIDEASRRGKTILLPKTRGKGRMDLHVFSGWESVGKGAYGIPEPSEETERWIEINAIDCALVPGVVFDRNGGRIGYGGGYYDRFFARLESKPWSVGVGYHLQLLERVPTDLHDVRMNEIITERETVVLE